MPLLKRNVKVIKNPNRYTYKESMTNRYGGKKIVYSNFARELLRENPGIIKAVNFLSNNKKEKRFVDEKNRFEILKVTNQIINKKRTDSSFASDGFVLIINKKKPVRFFIKETRDKVELSLTEELIALRLIEKDAREIGFKIIKPHFAFDSYLDRKKFPFHRQLIKSFIVYELSYLPTVRDVVNKKKINVEDVKKINQKFSKLKEILKKKGLRDIDLDDRNCFIDLSKKPFDLFLFDPLTYDANYNVLRREIEKI